MATVKLAKCTGEAHSNPYIDNCMICAPYWEEYPTCSACGSKLPKKQELNGVRTYRGSGCRDCKKGIKITVKKYALTDGGEIAKVEFMTTDEFTAAQEHANMHTAGNWYWVQDDNAVVGVISPSQEDIPF